MASSSCRIPGPFGSVKQSRFYSLPPAGTRISPAAVLQNLGFGGDAASRRAPWQKISEYLGSGNLLSLCSGRAALWLILKAAAGTRTGREEVVVPAYTCPAVVSAVLEAGLNPVLCDINLDDFGYLDEELAGKINSRTLAVIVVHLFGYPSDVEKVLELARDHGVYVIEDAAQAFGNPPLQKGGRRPGLQADAGFFSFGRGKPLSVLHGGVLVTSLEDLHREALRLYQELREPGGLSKLKYAASLIAYSFFSKPHLYWLPLKMPFLHLGETFFEKEFALRRGLVSAGRVAAFLLDSAERETEARGANAAWFSSNLENISEVERPTSLAYPYLRYPLRVRTRTLRDRMLTELTARGLEGGAFYPCPLNELRVLKEILQDTRVYPNARNLSERLITLPVHGAVTVKHRNRVLETIREVCRG